MASRFKKKTLRRLITLRTQNKYTLFFWYNLLMNKIKKKIDQNILKKQFNEMCSENVSKLLYVIIAYNI